MTFGDSGLVHRRIGEVQPGMSSSARHVFAVMVGVVEIDDPACFLSHETLAERTGLGVRTVQRALRELETAGAIARDGRTGRRTRTTVRWRLPLLDTLRKLPPPDRRGGAGNGPDGEQGSAMVTDKQPVSVTGTGSATMAEEHPAMVAEEHPATMADNPSDSVATPREPKERGRSASASAPAPSAGAPGACAADASIPDTVAFPNLVAYVRRELGGSVEFADDYVQSKIRAGGGLDTVKNPAAYIRGCVSNDKEPPSDPPSPKGKPSTNGKASGTGGKGTGKARRKPPRSPGPSARDDQGRPLRKDGKPRLRTDEIKGPEAREITDAIRAGESVASVAEHRNLSEKRVREQVQHLNRIDARAAVDRNEDPDAVAERFDVSADSLRSHLRRRHEDAAIQALRDGHDSAAVAERTASALGEPITADQVQQWLADRDRANRVGRERREHLDAQRRRQKASR